MSFVFIIIVRRKMLKTENNLKIMRKFFIFIIVYILFMLEEHFTFGKQKCVFAQVILAK
jgi:hypothetical protein